MHFLELVLVAIDGETSEALRAEGFRHRIAVAFRFAVVGELVIRVARDRRSAGIANLQTYIDDVAVTPEGEDLLDLQAVFALRREAQLEHVGAGSECARARLCLP